MKKPYLFVAALSAAAVMGLARPSPAAEGKSAAGFDTGNVDVFANALSNDKMTSKNVAVAAERLRAGFSLNPEQFAKHLSGLEQVAVNGAFGRINSGTATDIAWFFRGAVTHVETDKLVPVVTYYNPLADVAAVSTWRRIDSAWRVTAISTIEGATLRGNGVASPWWAVAGKPYAQAIAEASAASIAGAKAWGARGLPSRVIDFRVLNARLSTMVDGIRKLAADKPRADAANKVRLALAAAKPADAGLSGDNAPSAAQLQTLSSDVRRTLAVVTTFDLEGGKIVALSSPLQPDLVFFADFADGAQPKRVSAIQLAAT